jgi:hypothetical protein
VRCLGVGGAAWPAPCADARSHRADLNPKRGCRLGVAKIGEIEKIYSGTLPLRQAIYYGAHPSREIVQKGARFGIGSGVSDMLERVPGCEFAGSVAKPEATNIEPDCCQPGAETVWLVKRV